MKGKIIELQQEQEKYTKAHARAKTLLNALNKYDKKAINKTFFEKFFLVLDENGNAKQWGGKNHTEFSLHKGYYSHNEHLFEIYLEQGESITDIESRERTHIIEKTEEKLENLSNWIKATEKKIEFYSTFNLDELKEELTELLKKHEALEYWYTIHDRVRFLKD